MDCGGAVSQDAVTDMSQGLILQVQLLVSRAVVSVAWHPLGSVVVICCNGKKAQQWSFFPA